MLEKSMNIQKTLTISLRQIRAPAHIASGLILRTHQPNKRMTVSGFDFRVEWQLQSSLFIEWPCDNWSHVRFGTEIHRRDHVSQPRIFQISFVFINPISLVDTVFAVCSRDLLRSRRIANFVWQLLQVSWPWPANPSSQPAPRFERGRAPYWKSDHSTQRYWK